MPKKSIDIKTFQGMIGSVDARDAPAGSAVYAENVDNIQNQGLFTPLPEDKTIGNAGYAECDLVTVFLDGSSGVIYDSAASKLRAISLDTGGTEDDSSATRAADANGQYWDTGISDGESAHIGLGPTETSPPKWVGQIGHRQFSVGSLPSGIQFEEAEIKAAECVGVHGTTTTTVFMLPQETVTDGISRWDNTQEVFEVGRSYYYYASLVYDGFQEGPLFLIATLGVTESRILFHGTGDSSVTATYINATNVAGAPMGDYTEDFSTTPSPSTKAWTVATTANATNEQPATGLARVQFELRVRTGNDVSGDFAIPPRITRINLYRAEDVTGTVRPPFAWQEERFAVSDPLLFQSIDINDTGWTTEVLGAGTEDFDVTGDDYAAITIKDSGVGLETYTGRTGLPLGLSNMQLHYGVSCVAESYHIVGRCWHPDLKQIDSWLFKSKPYRYDTFDWTSDYLVLPSPPNALAYWGGKIYAFCSGRIYVINPISFDIEDTLEGMGAEHRKSICLCDRGMFWADDNNIYVHDGNTITPIGGAVLLNQYNDNAAWLKRATTGLGNTPVVGYSPNYDSIIVGYLNNSDRYAALMFNIGGKRWSYLTTSVLGAGQTLSCSFTNQQGEIVFGFRDSGVGNGEYFRLFGEYNDAAPVFRSWAFVSQQIKDGGSKTKYYDIRVHHTGSPPTVTFYDDDPDYTTAHPLYQWAEEVAGVSHKGGVQLTPEYDYDYLRDFAIKVEGTGSQSCSEITIIFRPLGDR